LFVIILGDVDWLELPCSVAGGDVASKSWEAITVIDVTWITAVLAASRVDDVSSIMAFIDLLP
jgi:hypothetical protein